MDKKEFNWLADLLPTINIFGKPDHQKMLSIFKGDCMKYGMNGMLEDVELESQPQNEQDTLLVFLEAEEGCIVKDGQEHKDGLECMWFLFIKYLVITLYPLRDVDVNPDLGYSALPNEKNQQEKEIQEQEQESSMVKEVGNRVEDEEQEQEARPEPEPKSRLSLFVKGE
jgi:hypothetical protein